MAKAIKKKKIYRVAKGKNIRFSTKGHSLLSNFCKKNGYNLGAFCEIAATMKMQKEVESLVE